jgi:pyrroline-5-carboxylate reductase
VTPTFGVVGLGRMAQALLFPLLEAGLVEPDAVRAVVASETSAAALRQAHHGLDVDTDPAAAWAAPVGLLSVKPQHLDLAAQAAAGGSGGLLVSVLAGVTLERLQRLFPQRQCVRAVPNTPALVGLGATGLAALPGGPATRA